MTVRSGTALVTVNGDIPIDPSGLANLYVDAMNGNDDNTGLTAGTAFATFGAAVVRMNAWLANEIDADLVINVAPGTYNEDVEFILQSIPLGRVVVKADPALMTEIFSGTLTAATAQLVTDAAAAFGAANEQVGLLIEVFDPATPATTRQYKTIRSHTNTAISPVGPFSPAPIAGWNYRVLSPSVNIVGQGSGGFFQNAALLVVCPWETSYDGNEEFAGGGPMLGFMFIRVTGSGFGFAIRTKGGFVKWTGVVVDGAGPGFGQFSGTAAIYGGFPGIDDPIYETTATYSPNVDSCLGIRVVGVNLTGIRVGLGATMFGSPALLNSDLVLFTGRGTFFGGAVHGGLFDIAEQSEVQIFGGSVNAADTLLPFLLRSAPGNAVVIREGSRAEFTATAFQVCAAAAFAVESIAFLRVLPTIAAGVGDVIGVGVWCQNGAKAEVGSGVTFTTTASNLRVGNGVDADGNSTFAALTVSAPLIDHPNDNGRGAMGVQPGSLASIWEV